MPPLQPVAASRESTASSVSADVLDKLRELTASPLDEGSAPTALAIALEAVHLRFGALLRYESESQSLTMMAQDGLAQQAIDAIRMVRRGVSGVWDMPLHAVLQRRVYIIDKPKENPFVPTLLQGTEQGLLTNAAVMPLFAAGSVSGALLLIGSGKRAIHEHDILALREIAKLLGAALRQPPKVAGRAPHVLTQPIAAPAREETTRDRAMFTARISELESQVESLRRSAGGGPSVAENERRLAELTRERDRYKSEAAHHEIALKNLRSEHDLLRDQNATEAERARKVAVELARARDEVTRASERSQRLTEELGTATRARGELEQRFTALERQFGDTANQAQVADSTRADLAARLSTAQRDAEELRKTVRGREEQITELRAERERLTASLQKAAARYHAAEDATGQLRESGELAQAELRSQVEALQAHVEEVERERNQMAAGMAGRAEVIREIERETEKFRSELAREVERRRVAEQTSSSVIHDAAALRAEAERIQAERQMAHAEAERSRTEVEKLSAELTTLRARSQSELTELRQRAAELEKRAAEAESARAALAAEADRLRPELESRRRTEAELRAREMAREEAERKTTAETAELRKRLEEVSESVRSLTRERDGLTARAATLEEATAKLLREGETLRAEREQRDRELEQARVKASAQAVDAERLLADVERLRGGVERGEAELAEARRVQTGSLDRNRALEQELAALRDELERAQSRGSELTAELARRAQQEGTFQAAAADAQKRSEEAETRRLEEELARKELQARLGDLEQALQGASADLAEKSRQVDFASVLRATLAKSESARRAAEDSVVRLETALVTERDEAARARMQAESEREAAQELARRVDEIERKLVTADEATIEATNRAGDLAAAEAAARETTESLAAELGRKTADLNELSSRFDASQRDVGEREAAVERALERAQALETSARKAAEEIEALKRRTAATQDEKDREIHELELRIAEGAGQSERIAADMKIVEQERDRLREAIQALENDRRQVSDGMREASAKTATLEAAVQRSKAESERLAAELEPARQHAAALETQLRSLEEEGARWRSVGEKLQATLEEREHEIQALKSVPRAAPPVAAEKVAAKPAATPKPLVTPKAPPLVARQRVITNRTVVILDDPGPGFNALAQAVTSGGFEPRTLDNGSGPTEPPAYTAVNLLAPKAGGLEALMRSRSDERLAASGLFLYATKPGSAKGVVFDNVGCLVRPIEEKDFLVALADLLGTGKRVTIIGEELDSVLKLNAWATARGCSVSSAGDLKQGNEILDIVKPDLIVFDFSRLGGEGAGLAVKTRRSPRLESLPVLLVLPVGAQSPSASFFLKRLGSLADETPLNFTAVTRRLTPPEKV